MSQMLHPTLLKARNLPEGGRDQSTRGTRLDQPVQGLQPNRPGDCRNMTAKYPQQLRAAQPRHERQHRQHLQTLKLEQLQNRKNGQFLILDTH